MEALKQKFKSRRGASILLALLFLLVCMMVGASVVMAADSNVGKIRSNREEQQKYLTLSSALTLLCDELTHMTYVGNYTYKLDNTVCTHTPQHEDGHHIYEQATGSLTGPNDFTFPDDWTELAEVLPLRKELDWIFADLRFKDTNSADDKDYTPSGSGNILSPSKHTLTLTVGGLDDKLLKTAVEVTVELNKSTGAIVLTATMDGYPAAMEATLTLADGNLYEKLSLGDPAGLISGRDYPTDSITWKLKQIAKKDIVGEGGD